MKRRNRLCLSALLVLVILSLMAVPVLGYLYRAPVSITENTSTNYTMLPVLWDQNNTWLASNGFMASTANDTRVQTLGGSNKPWMVADNKTLTAIPVPADSQTNLYFVTGESAASAMDIIFGHGGSANTTDNAALELGDNCTIETTDVAVRPPLSSANVNLLHFARTAASNVNCGVIYDSATKLWVSCWFKLDNDFSSANVTNMHVWGKQQAANNYIDLRLNQVTGAMDFYYINVGVVKFNFSTTQTTWEGGTWYHVITSISSVNGARMIVDGTAFTDADTTALFAGGSFCIGDLNDPGTGAGFAGVIRDVVVGTDDLTAGEEAALYTGTTPGDETNRWYLDYGTGTTVYSYGSAANAGTADTDTSWQTGTAPVVEEVLAYKPGAFRLSIGGASNTVIGKIVGGSRVSTTGVSTGEHDIDIVLDSVDIDLLVDTVSEDSTALGGVGIPDTGTDWSFLRNTPYAGSIDISVGGTPVVEYAPASMISGTTLPNALSSGTHDGTITWGVNPNGVGVILGSMTSSGQSSVGSSADTSTSDLLPVVGGTDWRPDATVSAQLQANPLRPIVTAISDNTTLSEYQVWVWLGITFVAFITVLVGANVRGHHLITGIAAAAAIILMIVWTVFPYLAVIVVVLVILGGLVSERSPSL